MTTNCAGLPESHYRYVQHVYDGMPVFLFHFGERKLYGVFQADGPGGMYLRRRAFAGPEGVILYPA